MLQSLPATPRLHASLLAGLAPDDRAPFLESAPRRHFSGGQLIQSRGEVARGCWLIEQGVVKLGQFDPDGRFVALTLLGPGESYGELALLRRGERTVDAIAQGDCTLRWIAAGQFEAVLAANPATMRQMLALLGEQLNYSLARQVGRIAPAATRLADLLAALAGTGTAPAVLPLTQQDLADLTGVTRMTISRELARLASAGLVRCGYRTIEVLSGPGLAAHAGRTA